MNNLRDRPNYRARWSPEDLAALAQAIGSGMTVHEIARAMGRSQEAVRNRATLAGLMKKRVIGPRSKAYRPQAGPAATAAGPA